MIGAQFVEIQGLQDLVMQLQEQVAELQVKPTSKVESMTIEGEQNVA